MNEKQGNVLSSLDIFKRRRVGEMYRKIESILHFFYSPPLHYVCEALEFLYNMHHNDDLEFYMNPCISNDKKKSLNQYYGLFSPKYRINVYLFITHTFYIIAWVM